MNDLFIEKPDEYRDRKHREGLETRLKQLIRDICDDHDYVYITVYDAKLVLRMLDDAKRRNNHG